MSAEFASPIDMSEYEQPTISLSKGEKIIYNQVKDINDVLLFSFSKQELKEMSKTISDILTKKNIKASADEVGLMSAALLLLVAGQRNVAPEHINQECVPFKFSDVSYVACVLKKYNIFKDKDLEKKLQKSFEFLSSELKISIQNAVSYAPRKTKNVVMTDRHISGLSHGQRTYESLRSGGPGVTRYIKFQKTEGYNPTARLRTRPSHLFDTKKDIQKQVLSSFKNKIEKQKNSKNKHIYDFIGANIEKDIDDINNILKKIKIEDQDVIKRNIKIAKNKIEEEVIDRLMKLNLKK